MDIQKYLSKVDVMAKKLEQQEYTSASMKQKVVEARMIQTQRFKGHKGIRTNSQMDTKLTETYCKVDTECQAYLDSVYRKTQFSARTYNKIMNLSRTFADLDGAPQIRLTDITAALMGRDLEKEDAFSFVR